MSCYAAHLGDCGGGLSREHYISKSVLEIAGNTIQVTGFPWQQSDKTAQIGIAALTAKILCKRHNEQLSPLDSVAKTFLAGLKLSFDEVSEDRLSNSSYETSGNAFELWLLKILVGVLPMHGMVVPKKWINILFKREPWPNGAGLHVFAAPGMVTWCFQLVRVISVGMSNDPRQILGAKFGIGGLAMLLAFGNPKFAEPGIESMYRPTRFVVEKRGMQNQLVLSWDDCEAHGSIILGATGSIENAVETNRPIVKPIGKIEM